MVWAEARGGVIGRGGEMPWHLPEDLAHFRRITSGSPVIMGRRTWESLPERFRPLPGRTNIVVTRDPQYDAPGAQIAHSLQTALACVPGETETVWIMGGGKLYRAAMSLADELVVTRIALDVDDADTHAPEIGAEWQLVDAGEELTGENGLGYRFERWERAGASESALDQIP